MSIMDRTALIHDKAEIDLVPNSCFLCSELTSGPFVVWLGYNATIALHPECATRLGCSLIYDAKRIEIAQKKGVRP